jgi:hypothetical protein
MFSRNGVQRHGFASAIVSRCRRVSGPVGGGPAVLALGSVLGSFTPVRGRSPAAAGRLSAWSRTLADAAAQYSKACEGASLPWVQIPPPPLLTRRDVNAGGSTDGYARGVWLSFWPHLQSSGAVIEEVARLLRLVTAVTTSCVRRCARPGIVLLEVRRPTEAPAARWDFKIGLRRSTQGVAPTVADAASSLCARLLPGTLASSAVEGCCRPPLVP